MLKEVVITIFIGVLGGSIIGLGARGLLTVKVKR